MKATYQFEPDNNLIVYRMTGALTTEGVMAVLNTALADPDWSPEYDMMCMFDGADFTNFTVSEAQRLSQAIRVLDARRGETPSIRAALVSSDMLANGLLTFWEGLGRTERSATDRVFTTETEARAWLASAG
ncbi:hypothetical protein [Maricaulis sp.]|uniref:hypothetical protein n=1 Tax=Maricaulis sp. TaxID=1486257 RepID=UPI003A8CB7AB